MKTKFKALIGAGVAAAIFVILYFLVTIAFPTVSFDPIFGVSVFFIILFLPYGYFDNMEMKSVYDAERRVPDFLRDIAEYTTFGMPISAAIVRASSGEYGSLTGEIRRVASMISWGISVEEALKDFGKSIGSDNVIRAGKIIVKAAESGSNISDVMTMVSDFYSQMHLLRNSRFAEMKNYTMVMMISYGVFLFVMITLEVDFLPKIGVGGFSLGSGSAASSIAGVKEAFNMGLVVQGAGTGIISGVLRDGRLSSGIMLAGIMLTVSLVVLQLIGGL